MDESQLGSTRRGFLKAGIAAMAALTLPFGRLFAEAKPSPKVSESEALAKTMNYVADAAKSKRPDKTQMCSNCMFYTAAGKKEGKCQIFQNRLVAAKGWCTSWAKKA